MPTRNSVVPVARDLETPPTTFTTALRTHAPSHRLQRVQRRRAAMWTLLHRLVARLPWSGAGAGARPLADVATHAPRQPPLPDGDSCGCALGARALIASLCASSGWYIWLAPPPHPTAGALATRILVVTFAGSLMGKAIGVAMHRYRTTSP